MLSGKARTAKGAQRAEDTSQQYVLNGGIAVERKEDREDPALDFIFTVVIMAVLGVFTALQAEPEPRNVREKGSSVNQWDTGWHYQADDGTEKTCEVPSQIKIRGGKIVLRQTIPEFSEEEKYLGFLNHYQQVEIYVDGVSRYRYMEQQTGTFHGMLGNNFCMTRLGREDAGKEITVIFSGFYREGLVQVPVMLSGQQGKHAFGYPSAGMSQDRILCGAPGAERGYVSPLASFESQGGCACIQRVLCLDLYPGISSLDPHRFQIHGILIAMAQTDLPDILLCVLYDPHPHAFLYQRSLPEEIGHAGLDEDNTGRQCTGAESCVPDGRT
ncbi:hypothetical protein LC724_35365 [Blautia sp. RD014234]|nr:hypothetical protein [Blautia parvula]